MNHPSALDYLDSASRWFGRRTNELDATARRVLSLASRRQIVTADPNQRFEAQITLGDRLADQVARFGGSWVFIIIFGVAAIQAPVIMMSQNRQRAARTTPDRYKRHLITLAEDYLRQLGRHP